MTQSSRLEELKARLMDAAEQLSLFNSEGEVEVHDMRRICAVLALPCRFSRSGDYGVLDGYVFEFPYDTDYDPTPAADFVTEVHDAESVAQDFGIEIQPLTEEFWGPDGEPPPLYHATPTENVESILEEGLGVRCDTRGISNRCTGAAVYTTTELSEAEYGSYGDAIFRIDTAAMQRDGYMPGVALEPDEEERQWREALAHRLGAEEYVWEIEQGMSPNTIVVFGQIPPKYLTLEGAG
jgi:hypothetical protein